MANAYSTAVTGAGYSNTSGDTCGHVLGKSVRQAQGVMRVFKGD